jgi:hypothetical protein
LHGRRQPMPAALTCRLWSLIQAQGRGLAGTGEGHHAQRAAGVGTPGCDDGVLLGTGLQGAIQRHLVHVHGS